MEAITFNDFLKIHKDQGYKYLQMLNPEGKALVAWNTGKVQAADRIKNIQKRMATLPGGYFVIRAKHSMAKTVVPDEFYIVKEGAQLSESGAANPKYITINARTVEVDEEPEERKNIRSYDSVLALEVRVRQLELENDALNKTIEDLEEELEALQSEGLSEDNGGLFGKNTMTWLQDMFTMASPAIDKHFELKEKQIQLETIKLAKSMGNFNPNQAQPAAQQRPAQPQMDPQAVDLMNKRIGEFIDDYSESDFETAESIVQIYNNAESIDLFFQTLLQQHPDVYPLLIDHINNKANGQAD